MPVRLEGGRHRGVDLVVDFDVGPVVGAGQDDVDAARLEAGAHGRTEVACPVHLAGGEAVKPGQGGQVETVGCDEETLEVVDHFGQQGIFGGSLNVPHALAVDSKGNIYVGENFDGRRFQRFVYKGMGAPTGKTLPPPKP